MSSEIIDPKEKLLLEYAITDTTLLAKIITIIEPEYFDEPLDRAVKCIKGYFTKYKNVPDVDIIHAETGIVMKSRTLSDKDEYDYVLDEMENHCKREAMRLAILKGADVINSSTETDTSSGYDYGAIQTLVKEALMVTVDKDIGISQFGDDVALRHMMMQEDIDSRRIGLDPLDDLLGDVRRGEMVIFAGGSGSGKSVTLANIGAKMSLQGLNTLLLSFELKESLISLRLDSILTGVSTKKVFDNSELIQEKFTDFSTTAGSYHVKKMRKEDTANNIRAYLLEYNLTFGYYPDVIIVDHMDLMGPVDKKVTGRFEIDKSISEDLRDVFDEFNVFGFTASQLNREAVDSAVKNQAMIAGGISKINTADAVVAISRTQEQLDNGEVEFQALKLRNTEMSLGGVILYWNDRNLQLTDTPPLGVKGVNSNQPASSKPIAKATTKNKPMKDRLKEVLEKSKRI